MIYNKLTTNNKMMHVQFSQMSHQLMFSIVCSCA